MLGFLQLLGTFVADLFKSRHRSKSRISFSAISSILRCEPRRRRLRGSDRALMVWMTWLWPSLLGLSRVVHDLCLVPTLTRSSACLHFCVGPRPTTAALVCCDPAPDRGVAGAADRGGIPVGHSADLFGA